MTDGILSALGGLGVFLLGMVVMTNGLKALTGNALRQALARFTKSPMSGAVTGAIATAIIQSSSATTVTAVGFVGAGLITFSQSLGIIFGANIGTTITGWLVAIVGFKLKIGSLALAGFGLIFVGIDLIQQGMAGLEGVVTPDSFPGDTFGGRILLLLIGVAVTLVTQSSSAGVATALTATHAGTISFEQAAVMVIGMDVGTTATAALATIGGSTDVRRTGFAHVIYNIMTGIIAFFLVTPYTQTCMKLFPNGFVENPEIALVGFHTFFNGLGVLLVLPVTRIFAQMIIWLVPRQPVKYTQRLDRTLYESPAVAFGAVRGTLYELAGVVFKQLESILREGQSDDIKDTLRESNDALKITRDYVTPIDTSEPNEQLYPDKMSAIHTIDHLRRLIDRCQESKRSERTHQPELAALGELLLESVRTAICELDVPPTRQQARDEASLEQLKKIWEGFEEKADVDRHSLIASAASGDADTHSTIQKLDTLRWIRRVSYHVWRIVHHLHGGNDDDNLHALEQTSQEM